MKKYSPGVGRKQLPALFFAIAGLFLLSVTGFLLSDPGRKLWNPQPDAAAYCTQYGDYSAGYCTNTSCPSGRVCAMRSLTGATNVKCTSHAATKDQILDCCGSGKVLNSAGTACVSASTPTPTPTPTGTPTFAATPRDCSWGSYPVGTCSNTSCGTNMGYDCRGEQVYNALKRKCKNLTGSGNTRREEIVDCCGSTSHVEGTSGNYHCVANVTPTPTRINCTTYGVWPLNTCSNATCSTVSVQRCIPQSVSGASEVKCANRADGVDEIRDCCPSGKVLNSSGTACVTSTTTTNPPLQTTVPATNTVAPTNTISATHTPSPTATPTPSNPTQSPTGTIVQTTTTGSPTGTPTPPVTGDPTSSIPPTTSPSINRTPSTTHAPQDTGFSEDILLYAGGTLYVIGVLAFVGARYLNVRKH